ncbi:MAG: hypothetical protein Alpg2KO_03110 [Alphaproteobacteria bacterium]
MSKIKSVFLFLALAIVLVALQGFQNGMFSGGKNNASGNSGTSGQAISTAKDHVNRTGNGGDADGSPTLQDLAKWGVMQVNESGLADVSQSSAVALDSQPLRRNFYIVFDGSGSMAEDDCGNRPKIETARDAFQLFLDTVPQGDNLGLFVFDGNGMGERVPLGNGRANRDNIINQVQAIRTGRSTPLSRSVWEGLRALGTQAMMQRGYGDYNLVIITDGRADNDRTLRKQVANVTGRTPIQIYTIGFCINDQHPLNIPGKVEYRSAMSGDELTRGLQGVLAEAESFDVDSFSAE